MSLRIGPTSHQDMRMQGEAIFEKKEKNIGGSNWGLYYRVQGRRLRELGKGMRGPSGRGRTDQRSQAATDTETVRATMMERSIF